VTFVRREEREESENRNSKLDLRRIDSNRSTPTSFEMSTQTKSMLLKTSSRSRIKHKNLSRTQLQSFRTNENQTSRAVIIDVDLHLEMGKFVAVHHGGEMGVCERVCK